MANNMTFDQPSLDWNAPDLHQEFERFKQHVNFTFKGPLSKASDKDKTGWLGMWIGTQGRETYKTFVWGAEEEDKPDKILEKFSDFVRPKKNK